MFQNVQSIKIAHESLDQFPKDLNCCQTLDKIVYFRLYYQGHILKKLSELFYCITIGPVAQNTASTTTFCKSAEIQMALSFILFGVKEMEFKFPKSLLVMYQYGDRYFFSLYIILK